MQTKAHSLIESITNVIVGYGIAVASQMVLFPCYGLHCETRTNLVIGLWFTVISLVRSYVLRRVFTKRTER